MQVSGQMTTWDITNDISNDNAYIYVTHYDSHDMMTNLMTIQSFTTRYEGILACMSTLAKLAHAEFVTNGF